MITVKDFIKICTSKNFDHCTLQEVGNNTVNFVDKVVFAKNKTIYFDDTEGHSIIKTPFKTFDIMNIYRIEPKNDNDYTYIIQLKDCNAYLIKITMKKGFTPYVLSTEKMMNYRAVTAAIPGYFDLLTGNDIIISKTSYSKIFSYYNEENDNDSHNITEQFIVPDFKYQINVHHGVPCIKISSNTNENIFVSILNVCMINDTTSGTIYVSSENGDYYFNVME